MCLSDGLWNILLDCRSVEKSVEHFLQELILHPRLFLLWFILLKSTKRNTWYRENGKTGMSTMTWKNGIGRDANLDRVKESLSDDAKCLKSLMCTD